MHNNDIILITCRQESAGIAATNSPQRTCRKTIREARLSFLSLSLPPSPPLSISASYFPRKSKWMDGSAHPSCLAGESSTPLGQVRHSPSAGLASGEEKHCGNAAPGPVRSSPVSSSILTLGDDFVATPRPKRIRYAEHPT